MPQWNSSQKVWKCDEVKIFSNWARGANYLPNTTVIVSSSKVPIAFYGAMKYSSPTIHFIWFYDWILQVECLRKMSIVWCPQARVSTIHSIQVIRWKNIAWKNEFFPHPYCKKLHLWIIKLYTAVSTNKNFRTKMQRKISYKLHQAVQ